ncbi:MAG: histidinol dehydrogenase [Nitrososphaerota archaeon]|nr:histidinol dehydrogenase [Nitrososphaerota archaeon]
MDNSTNRFNPFDVNDQDRRYVEQIMLDVKRRGDEALLDYTSRPKPFDNVKLSKDKLVVSKEELEEAEEFLKDDVKKAISFMMKRIKRIVEFQMKKLSLNTLKDNGLKYYINFYPLEKIGILVPGGRAMYVSTIIMAAYPAILVGVKEVHVLTPPRQDGSVNPAVLYAAKLMGLKRVYRCNMVAGVGALTFGTETIPKVEKIIGPGNRFVTLAKMIANSYGVSIDVPAGPSELVVLADSSADPKFIALDLVAQAEHSPDSFIALITNSKTLAESVEKIFQKLSEEYGLSVKMNTYLVESIEDGLEKCNSLAPEHVSLQVKNPNKLLDRLTTAGTIFLGRYSPPAVGDYVSGSNHILPTGGYAKIRGGVTVLDYLRLVSYQYFSIKYLKRVAKHVKVLSEVEGLPLHGASVESRIKRKIKA